MKSGEKQEQQAGQQPQSGHADGTGEKPDGADKGSTEQLTEFPGGIGGKEGKEKKGNAQKQEEKQDHTPCHKCADALRHEADDPQVPQKESK